MQGWEFVRWDYHRFVPKLFLNLYILKSTQYNRNYTGVTGSVENRLQEHNGGKSKSTKTWRPWVVFYTEQFSTLSEARKREWFLKCTPQGGKEKRKILEKAGIPAQGA